MPTKQPSVYAYSKPTKIEPSHIPRTVPTVSHLSITNTGALYYLERRVELREDVAHQSVAVSRVQRHLI